MSFVAGSIAASTEGTGGGVCLGSATGGFTNVRSSDCERTGVSSGGEEKGGGIIVGALVSNAGSGAFPHACSSALAKARRLEKRCCGSLASAIISTCSTSGDIVGSFSRKGGRVANICWVAISVKVP